LLIFFFHDFIFIFVFQSVLEVLPPFIEYGPSRLVMFVIKIIHTLVETGLLSAQRAFPKLPMNSNLPWKSSSHGVGYHLLSIAQNFWKPQLPSPFPHSFYHQMSAAADATFVLRKWAHNPEFSFLFQQLISEHFMSSLKQQKWNVFLTFLSVFGNGTLAFYRNGVPFALHGTGIAPVYDYHPNSDFVTIQLFQFSHKNIWKIQPYDDAASDLIKMNDGSREEAKEKMIQSKKVIGSLRSQMVPIVLEFLQSTLGDLKLLSNGTFFYFLNNISFKKKFLFYNQLITFKLIFLTYNLEIFLCVAMSLRFLNSLYEEKDAFLPFLSSPTFANILLSILRISGELSEGVIRRKSVSQERYRLAIDRSLGLMWHSCLSTQNFRNRMFTFLHSYFF
jgi:hypothetical protein